MTDIIWPKRLDLARLPTPITRIERFPGLPEGVDLRVKRDELTGMEVSGNKVRKLEFCLADALEQGCNTIITCGGLQSNHCRATAVLGARLGLKVHLLLRGEQPESPEGNLLLDQLCGASITYVPVRDWSRHPQIAADLQRDYASSGDQAYFIPVGASDEVGLWGYIAACAELKEDFRRLDWQPDLIVSATGSGGTQAGLIVGCRLLQIPAQVLAFNVSDDAAYFERKIRADVALWSQRYKIGLDAAGLDIVTVEGYLGPGYGVAEAPVYETINQLARSDGLFLDPVYTGKAFHGMVNELARSRQSGDEQGPFAGARNVLFIHTGGLFGVFPHHRQFNLA